MFNLTLTGGQSTNGGAVYNDGGMVNAEDCVFAGNTAKGLSGTNGIAGRDDGKGPGMGGDGGNANNARDGWAGAVYNLGTMWCNRCLFLTNQAMGGQGGNGGSGGNGSFQGGHGGKGGHGGAGYGGAVFNQATLFLTNCVLESNTASGGNGGAGGAPGAGAARSFSGDGGQGAPGSGGGLYNLGAATLVNCTFVNNRAVGGNSATGGAFNYGAFGTDGFDGALSLGGAIVNLGLAIVINCTFATNQVTGGNGGMGGNGDWRAGDGGSGGNGLGGGIYNFGTANVTNCTLASNKATGGNRGPAGAGPVPGTAGDNGTGKGGNIASEGGAARLRNCVVADSPEGGNGYGTITDTGYNLSSDASCGFSAVGSMNRSNPKLASLANNGGYTKTLALLSGSPAIDAGDPVFCLANDQRGAPRPTGVYGDIGAYEFGVPTFRVQGFIGEGTNGLNGFRITAGIQSALSDTNGNYTISGLFAGVYTVFPPNAGVGFNPASRTITLGPDAIGINFIANGALVTSITGTSYGPKQLSFLALPELSYWIQASTDLKTWENVSTNTANRQGVFQFIDTQATNLPMRFYRTAIPTSP
jgi:hypothetical protein